MERQFNRRAQAVVELAILGTLILLAFSYIMNFSQSLSAMQQVKMETFRRAMQKAYIRNGSVDFALKKNIRSAGVNSGFGHGQGLSPQASSKVMWQKGMSGDFGTEGEGAFSFWQLNDSLPGNQDSYGLPRYEKTVVNNDGSEREALVPVSVYKTDEARTEDYSFRGAKQEGNSSINYNRSVNLTDTVSGTAYAHYDMAVDENPWDDDTPTAVYSSPTVFGYGDSKTYTYQDSWSTPVK